MTKRAVIVCGCRHAEEDPAEHLEWAARIRKYLKNTKPEIMIEGEAKGIDTIAKGVAESMEIAVIPKKARWLEAKVKFGNSKKAGPIRNMEMLAELRKLEEEGYEIAVLAFHEDWRNSSGTKSMIEIAKRADVRVLAITKHDHVWV